jgi:hypothetical protein
MKSKKQKAAEYAAYKAKKERLGNLASLAVEKYTVAELLDALYEWSDTDEFDYWCKSHLNFKDGAVIIYPQSIAEEARINDLLDVMYPNSNDKQIALFAA